MVRLFFFSLMMAPMVSTEFWQKLCRDYLSKKGSGMDLPAKAPLMIAAEETKADKALLRP